ncbi:hypothetical protein [Dickeya chrysanthemi]|uniref:hypothetical protein n=1 Tax=Dickeya chrysanthemi TaxID=556 RepID=UPI00301ADA1B
MMQIQRYLDDTYCFSATSEVIATGTDSYGSWLALRENIFHPQGGGQPADTGWINDIPVSIRKDESGLVVVYPQSSLEFDVETRLQCRLSAPERMRHAALHTAGHLLNWEMRRYGWRATSGHHFPGESRVVFSPMGSSAVLVDRLPLQDIAAGISLRLLAGGEVKTWREGESRYSLIPDTEAMPCAGTHVNDISQIINFSIKSAKFKKDQLRISYDAEHSAQRND